MPTEAELAQSHGLSRQTVRRAYQTLSSEGLIQRTRGRGTFVTAVPPDGRYLRTFGSIDDLMAQSADSTMDVVEPLRVANDEELSRKLDTRGPVGSLLLRRLHAGQAFCLTKVSVPLPVMLKLAPLGFETGYKGGTVIEAIDAVWPSRISGAKQRIQAGPCVPSDASILGCEPGEPVLQVERLYHDCDGIFVELAESVYVGSRFTYQIELLRAFH